VLISDATDDFKSTYGTYYLYVENADESMAKALNAGGTLVTEVANMDYQDRQGGVKDPAGNIWWVSQRLVDEPY
ncbi:MAG: VOC family protein, partial [Pyrinomonadaceae bacterium]|nr:VOC family protein [Pyrinomonadaceae bacterium]